MSILCEGELIRSAIDDIGESVTVRVVTESGYNEWGDATISTSDSSVTVVISQLNDNEDVVTEGNFVAGDLRIFFKSADSSYAVVGNRVLRGTRWFQIKRVNDAYDTYYVEAFASRI